MIKIFLNRLEDYNNNEFKGNSKNSIFSTNYSSITAQSNNFRPKDINNKYFIIIDLRDKEEYDKLHIIESINFPAINIKRDKFPLDMVLMKNKPGKIIFMYHNDIKKGIKYINDCLDKGYSNIVFLDEGLEDFKENYPQLLEGPEKEKYLKIKKEKDDKKKNEFFFDFLD